MNKECISCKKNDLEVPLLEFIFKGQHYTICPQCLPVLIHTPHKLAKALPGIEQVAPSLHTH